MSENRTEFRVRPATQDQQTIKEVLHDNMYGLQRHLPAKAAIVDIGANIGAFAVACLARGAGRVVCFEPDPDCFMLLMQNVAAWGDKAELHNAAVWRKDEPAIFQPAGQQTACGYVLPQRLCRIRRISIPTTDLDSVIESMTEDGSRIALVKIDAEASEYPILYTSRLLGRVDEIVGETYNYAAMEKAAGCITNEEAHGFPASRCNIDGMTTFLREQGFLVSTKAECHDNEINHLFWAHRPGTPTPERLCQP